MRADGSSRRDVEQIRRWEFVWIRLLEASPLDAAKDLPALRVLDRVEEQTGLGRVSKSVVPVDVHGVSLIDI
jgi:hypothetical protein